MKKNNNRKKLKARTIVLSILIVVVLALLAVALYFYGIDGSEKPLVRSETVYLLLILLILLPILLFILVLVTMIGKKVVKVDTVAVSSGASPAAATETEQSRVEEGEYKEEAEGEESGGERAKRFSLLMKIDAIKDTFKRNDYEKAMTLEKLCNDLRNYSANQLHLYYSISDIRRFIAGLAVSKIIILQGMSGTGKTSLAYAFGMFLGNTSTVIPVQPMWKERTDLIGYFNEFTKRFNETDLLTKMYEALYSEDIYITVLDEMNIARVEYYFAEFLSLLELPNEQDRYLTVVSDKWETDPEKMIDGKIQLPPNMWFIGTANNDDSTFAISDKVYDRAMILNLDKKCEAFKAPKTKQRHIKSEDFVKLAQNAMGEYGLTRRNEHRLEELDKYLIENFHITFGNRIMKQIRTYIPVYVACGGEELEALDDILSKKVMRKLEMQNPVYVKRASDALSAYLDDLFGNDNMPMCKEYISKLKRNA